MANIITGIRILCALALTFVPTFSDGFYTLYLLGGVSDVLDGFVARHFGKVTELGSRLDTVADIAFTLVVLIKVVCTVYVPGWLMVWVACIATIKCINIVSALILYKRFIAEHTIANKICGLLLYGIPLCIGRFPWQSVAILVGLSCSVASFAALQEGRLIRSGKEIR